MTHPRRLVLAMILLVAVTSCVASAVTWYLVTQSPSDGAVTTIAAAAGAGGAIGILFAAAIAAGLAKFTHDPPLGDAASADAADVAGGPERTQAYQTLIDNEKMARAIIEGALDAFVQTDERCVVIHWSPHAEALMGWTRAEAVGRSVEELLFPEPLRAL
jgi:PAS domain-containing protein